MKRKRHIKKRVAIIFKAAAKKGCCDLVWRYYDYLNFKTSKRAKFKMSCIELAHKRQKLIAEKDFLNFLASLIRKKSVKRDDILRFCK